MATYAHKKDDIIIYDICANLTSSSFGNDLHKVIKSSFEENIGLINCGSTYENSLTGLELVEMYEDYKLYTTIGIHPCNANDWKDKYSDGIKKLIELEDKVVAVGECGLDYYYLNNTKLYQKATKKKQIYTFKKQIELAIKVKKPLLCHERDAFNDFIKILDSYKEELDEANIKVIIHCFCGEIEQAIEYTKRGYYLGFTGNISRSKNKELLKNISKIPLDKIMIETDSPHLTPSGAKGRNTPTNIFIISKLLAKKYKTSHEDLLKTVKETTKIVFDI